MTATSDKTAEAGWPWKDRLLWYLGAPFALLLRWAWPRPEDE